MTLEGVWNFPTLLSSWFYTDPIANRILIIIVLILFTITILYGTVASFSRRERVRLRATSRLLCDFKRLAFLDGVGP